MNESQIAATLERLSASGVSGYALLSAYLAMTNLTISQPFEFTESEPVCE